MKKLAVFSVLLFARLCAADITVDGSPAGPKDFPLTECTGIWTDSHDAAVVSIAAVLLSDDLKRTGSKAPAVSSDAKAIGEMPIIIGTIGQSSLVDQLIADTKLDVTGVKGKWEASLWQMVENPLPGVKRALVIAGADRRGTAYGVMDLSSAIGVSPWIYWADVPAITHSQLRLTGDCRVSGSPKVKYRGIFLNDEDFCLRPWASKTLDPESGKMGPKVYEKIFELMLRLKLDYIWPAMHPGGTEFSTYPGNAEAADRWAIVTGSSHCEPMLRNNVFWPKTNGPWRYDTNRDQIFDYWKESAINRGAFEAVWTLGIRGIHDSAMEGPKDLHQRVKMVENTITDERTLIDQYVTKKYGPPAEVFVPYKEVLPLYNAGMQVPDDVTLMWPDDNYGYIRRVGTNAERKRSGGSGIYYHLSYWGGPHSYLWLESTAPGLMWQELRETYDNDSNAMWIVNVGDIKPAEMCIDFFSRMAWNPSVWGPDSQDKFLASFDAQAFGSAAASVRELQDKYYALACARKPEHIDYKWYDSMSSSEAERMIKAYKSLLADEKTVAAAIPPDRADAYFETVGYSARMLGAAGLLYSGDDENAIRWKKFINEQTDYYNNELAGGKWKHMMNINPEGVSWPAVAGGKQKPVTRTAHQADSGLRVVDAVDVSKLTPAANASWQSVSGLGWSGRAMSLQPVTLASSWHPDHLESAPAMEYEFTAKNAGETSLLIHALPTMRLTPEGHLRIAISVDGQPPQPENIPGGQASDENSKSRSGGVLANRVTIAMRLPALSAGKHSLKIYAVDPGVVIDQLEFPE